MSSWLEERDGFVNSVTRLFKVKRKEVTARSVSLSEREMDPDIFISRIKPQIKEVISNNLSYSTPEEWDKSFYSLGGGRLRRKSYAILNRMSWGKFIEYVEKISKEM